MFWSRRRSRRTEDRTEHHPAPRDHQGGGWRDRDRGAADGPVAEAPGEWDDRSALFGEEPDYEYADEEEAEWFEEQDDEPDADDEFTRPERWEDPAAHDGNEFREEDFRYAASGWSELPVVETLLSRKPRQGSVAAVVWTLGILAVVSALYWWGPREIADSLPASGETVFGRGEAWRLFTAMGAHADAIHLLSNAAFLTGLIYFAYGAFGPSLYPWSAVPVAALSLAVTLEGYPPNIRVVGASGLLYLLAGAWLTLYVLVERRLTIPKRLLRATGVFLIVLVPTSIDPEVSYRAHGIGFFFGICLALAYYLGRRDAIRAAERRAPPEY